MLAKNTNFFFISILLFFLVLLFNRSNYLKNIYKTKKKFINYNIIHSFKKNQKKNIHLNIKYV